MSNFGFVEFESPDVSNLEERIVLTKRTLKLSAVNWMASPCSVKGKAGELLGVDMPG